MNKEWLDRSSLLASLGPALGVLVSLYGAVSERIKLPEGVPQAGLMRDLGADLL